MNIDRNLLRASWQSWISSSNQPRAGPWWLQWLWTLLFSAALALPFTAMAFPSFARHGGAWHDPGVWIALYAKNFIVCLTVAVTIHLLFDLGRLALAKVPPVRLWKHWQRGLYFGGTSMLGLVLGWPLGLILAGQDVGRWMGSPQGSNILVGGLMFGLLLNFVFYQFFASRAREIEAQRRATESQLRLLQAQIEPHFLFNTLANVQSLMDHDPPKAKRMLGSFTDYLRASLGNLREDSSPVGQELDLALSYLQLLEARMEDRLRFTVEGDAEARQLPLPPLLLQPLVENAVVHGLEPSVAGGSVRVSAKIQGSDLVLEVQDDGMGLQAGGSSDRRGASMALDNVRQRLLAAYGNAASLELQALQPGTLARIRIQRAHVAS